MSSDFPAMNCTVWSRVVVYLREHGTGRVASRTAMKPQPTRCLPQIFDQKILHIGSQHVVDIE